MGDLVLIRHGETEWTLSGWHTSFTDLALTADGEEQARAVAPLLAEREIALALTSPLRRAVRTAQLAGLTDVSVDVDLHEWNYGAYEGITTADIHRSRPGWNLWTDGSPSAADGHVGESPEQVGIRADRVLARMASLLQDPGSGDGVLVAHGHFLRVLTARWLGLPSSAGAMFALGTGTLSRLGTEHGRPVISAWNVTARTPSARKFEFVAWAHDCP
ncbi:histidine phosphatase family protein [Streptomyces chiangmaiensis]|uniref:Histidine phosphatase family protein n=1 Tax=Streptomyces chiangmaiensis TaxID=766497 RepID=A0ABU7FKM2_9ACTN|nr:histidine phosphatase family protein [Streptomyces chiangmaiensis]MED7824666.1 histidine phosphatase family protein [Streptomyces chiangmaiensis]